MGSSGAGLVRPKIPVKYLCADINHICVTWQKHRTAENNAKSPLEFTLHQASAAKIKEKALWEDSHNKSLQQVIIPCVCSRPAKRWHPDACPGKKRSKGLGYCPYIPCGGWRVFCLGGGLPDPTTTPCIKDSLLRAVQAPASPLLHTSFPVFTKLARVFGGGIPPTQGSPICLLQKASTSAQEVLFHRQRVLYLCPCAAEAKQESLHWDPDKGSWRDSASCKLPCEVSNSTHTAT